jgi:hypothetical protein
MAAANARAEAAIITRSGFTADFADFAIAVPSDRRKRGAYFLQISYRTSSLVTIKRPLALPASCKPPAYECGTDEPIAFWHKLSVNAVTAL